MSLPPPAPPPPTQSVAPTNRTNGMAIASLSCSIGSFLCAVTWILGIVFGHIALNQIKHDPTQDGRGVALAGAIIGWTFAALFIIGTVLLVTVD